MDDLDERGSGKLRNASGTGVIGIAGDPQIVQTKPAREREQQPDAASGIAVAAVSRVDRVADMSCVELDVGNGGDTKIDGAKLLSGLRMDHAELIHGNFVHGVGKVLHKLQGEIAIREH
jgi:hypothetical protein